MTQEPDDMHHRRASDVFHWKGLHADAHSRLSCVIVDDIDSSVF